METFGTIIAWVFGLFWVLVSIGALSVAYDMLTRWKKESGKELTRKSDMSDDFMEERQKVLGIISDRVNMDPNPSDKELERLEKLRESSEFASLVRCAHFAGYHLTFEQNEGRWEDDPEYLDENVFKTDIREAAALREEREWAQYKRYFDPPMSKRERALKNIS